MDKQFSSQMIEEGLCTIVLRDTFKLERLVSLLNIESDFSDLSVRFILTQAVVVSKSYSEWTWQTVLAAVQAEKDRPVGLEYPAHYFAQLVSGYDQVADQFEQLLRLLLSISQRRKIKSQIHGLSDEFDNVSVSMDVLRRKFFAIEELFYDQRLRAKKARVVAYDNLMVEIDKDIGRIVDGQFIGTGYDQVDSDLTWGFAPGQVSVIMGRPSMGKSTLRANIICNLSDLGIGTLTISKEQSLIQEYFRFIAIRTGLSIKTVRDVNNWAGNKREILETLALMSSPKWPHIIVDPSGPFYLRDVYKVIESVRTRGADPKVVFIDLFSQLDDLSTVSIKYKPQLIGNKIMQIADSAKLYDIHFCLLIQMRRIGKDRENIDPREYAKESGAYEERSDLVIQVYRSAYYCPKKYEDNEMELRVIKQRDGPVKNFMLDFDKESLLITSSKRTKFRGKHKEQKEEQGGDDQSFGQGSLSSDKEEEEVPF